MQTSETASVDTAKGAPQSAPALAEWPLPETSEALAVIDAAWKILRINRAFTDITGYAAAEICGRPLHRLLADEPSSSFWSVIGPRLAATGAWSGEIRSRRQDGSLYPGRLSIGTLGSQPGQGAGYLLTHSDLSRRQFEDDLIRHLTDHDPLTGLPNWGRLQGLLAETLAAAGDGREVALIMVDLDRFRTLNEGLGHHFGDYLLHALAERLVRHAGPQARVARRGGDEFCIILAPCANAREAAATLAPQLLGAIAEPLRCLDEEYGLTASAGISVYPADTDNAASLLRYADVATDHAKQAGRNQFQFFSPAMKAAIDERLLLERGLRHAVKRAQLELHYQPLVDLAGGCIGGVEALVRWQHPELGLIPPDRFIALAEETGCIGAIGDWVLHEACRQGQRWHQAGYRHLQMAVNVSPLQFRQHHFPERVAAILAETGFAADCLDLEITEGAIMREPEQAVQILQQFKRLRMRISVDDFGTGHSSLAYLKRFPIDRLKIDRSFVKDCHWSRHDAAIVDTIINLARNLGLEVVAEGVENEAQRQFLLSRHCDLGQGYLFSRPRPAAAMTALLASERSGPARPLREIGRCMAGV